MKEILMHGQLFVMFLWAANFEMFIVDIKQQINPSSSQMAQIQDFGRKHVCLFQPI